MIKQGISSRYSKVLFNLDKQQNADLEKRLIDFENLEKLFQKNPKLLHLLKFPLIDIEEKKKLLKSALKETFDQTFYDFIFYIIKKEKLDYLTQIAHDYRLMVDRDLNICELTVVTAVELGSEMLSTLKVNLEKIFQKRLKIKNEVDPAIIGGVKLVFANQMMDWSVLDRLKNLKESLLVK
jgi:F-type H+-transporting ATPase subunit delta